MSQQNRKSQLTILFITVFIYLLGFGIIIPIIPILSRDFGATATESGLLMSIFSLMQFLFSPFWGKLSDRWGRRPILMFCLLCEGLCYILFASADNLATLFVARGLAGFFGASISTASAYISDITEKKDRSKGMALIGVAFGLGFVFGPALGGMLAGYSEHISTAPHFKTSFASYVVAGLCFANFIFAYFKLSESKKNKIQFSKKSEPATESEINYGPASRLKNIIDNLKIETLGTLIIIFFLMSMSMSSMEATLILYMGDLFQWGVKEVSLGFLYIGIIMIITQGFIVRRLLPLWGERKVLITGLILFIIGMATIPLGTQLWMLAISMTFLSLGNGLTNPSILGSVSLLSKNDEQGEKLGLTQSLSSLGRILGPPLGGFVYSHWMIQAPFLISALFSLMGLALSLRIFAKIPVAAKLNGSSEKTTNVFGIGSFQINNLIKNKIPFTFVCIDHEFPNTHFDGENQKHLQSVILNFKTQNKTAPQSAAELKKILLERKKETDQSLVLISETQKPAEDIAKALESAGFLNVYFVLGGYEDLIKDL